MNKIKICCKINEINWMKWDPDGANIPKCHPTQKPQSILRKLIEIFTDEGDTVIDPVAGSGSTLRAARDLGRNSYGFEIYKPFYKQAIEEMLNENYGEFLLRKEQEETGQMNIFDLVEKVSEKPYNGDNIGGHD